MLCKSAAPRFETIKKCSPSPRDELQDKNDNCKNWALKGECERNPKYMQKACRLSCEDFLPTLPDVCEEIEVPIENVEANCTPELDSASLLEPAPEADPALGKEIVEGSESEWMEVQLAQEELDKASLAHKDAQVHEQSVLGNLSLATEARQVAETDMQNAEEHLRKSLEYLNAAQNEKQEAEATVREWEGLVAGNVSLVEDANNTLLDRQEKEQAAKREEKESFVLVEGLEKAYNSAVESEAEQKQAAIRTRKELDQLANHVKTLNASLQENLTSIVSDWFQNLQPQEKKRDLGSKSVLSSEECSTVYCALA